MLNGVGYTMVWFEGVIRLQGKPGGAAYVVGGLVGVKPPCLGAPWRKIDGSTIMVGSTGVNSICFGPARIGFGGKLLQGRPTWGHQPAVLR